MSEFKIGTVTIEYDENGNVKAASFEPNKKVEFDETLLKQLGKLTSNDKEDVRKHANLVLGGFFSKMTSIELADPSLYKVDSEVIKCENYPSGGIAKCVIEYVFKPI